MEEKEEEVLRVCKMGKAHLLTYIRKHFPLSPSNTFSNYTLSQMKAHLTCSMSNEIKSIIKVNVLLKIHALVSRVTVFNEIRENSYL